MNERDLPPIERLRFIQTLSSLQPGATPQQSHLLAVIDLSNLAVINQSLGQTTGNTALLQVWKSLCKLSRVPLRTFRIDGNRFAFIASDLANYGFAVMVANRLKVALSSAFNEMQMDVSPIIHVGITLFQAASNAHTAYDILNQAERSLGLDKHGVPYHEHPEKLITEPTSNADLHRHFTHALRHNEFELFYQPKLHCHSGTITSVEALLRWKPDGTNYTSPLKVLDLAQQNNCLFQLTKWVVYTAVKQIADWRKSGLGDISVAVNVPADLIHNPDITGIIKDALAIWDTPSHLLTVEMTETAIMVDKNSGTNNLNQLRDLGVAVSIDDFGTGFSSLSYFKSIPADEIKIDQSFIRDIHHDHETRELVKIILEIAEVFGLRCVAEGIEDENTLALLRDFGCDLAQGYHIARPMPPDALVDWLGKYQPLL